ncbi:histidine phosphatase family protein [Pyruvatibacter sp.]|uniref:SixA phosphatase family protein n=1 Tax=Pyruvatibacter sp. TaxID=1981328 RepID=UPI0032EB45A9
MKRLILMRHAKSSWSEEDTDDHARPLNARGQAAAARMGLFLKQRGILPQAVICSTAQRTCETLNLVLEAAGITPCVIHDRQIYLAMPEQMIGVAIEHLQRDAPTSDCAMILGHNPGTHALALALAKSGDPQKIRALNMKYPTGAVTVIECDTDTWEGVVRGGRLMEFALPREIDA